MFSNSNITTPCKITDAIRWKAPELFPEYKLQNIKNYFEKSDDMDDFDSIDQINDKDYSNVIGKISIYSDIFSVGRLFYEIIFQKIPFYDIINEVQVEYMIIHNKYPSKFKISSSALERNILYSNKMWDILEKTWHYDPFDRISLMTIATLLIQLRNQQLQINNELKESMKQTNEIDYTNGGSMEFIANANFDLITPSNDQSIINIPSVKESKQTLHMKHSVSVNYLSINDSNLDIDNINYVRHHRRSISNIETNSTQNLVSDSYLSSDNSNKSLDKLKPHYKSSGRIPKSMTMSNLEDIYPNSSQIVNSKVTSIETKPEVERLTKYTSDLSLRNEEKCHHGSSKLEKPKLCVR